MNISIAYWSPFSDEKPFGTKSPTPIHAPAIGTNPKDLPGPAHPPM